MLYDVQKMAASFGEGLRRPDRRCAQRQYIFQKVHSLFGSPSYVPAFGRLIIPVLLPQMFAQSDLGTISEGIVLVKHASGSDFFLAGLCMPTLSWLFPRVRQGMKYAVVALYVRTKSSRLPE